MWCRKRIDIGWSDLALGVGAVLFRYDAEVQQAAIERAWPSGERGILSCLSVRSGWDLLLEALALPAGSEVLMSAMTIPDMSAIVKAHNLVPVPLELDPDLAAPTPETLRRAITPKSKIVLIAHLFGNRADLDPHIDIAREHEMLFVEDCAQAYAGTSFVGHPRADVSMFSFGNIKTRTALGGGVLHLADKTLLEQLKARQAEYTLQSRGKYLQRLLKYGGLKLVATYPVFAGFTKLCRLLGIDQGAMLNRSVRGFAATEGLERFRRQPAAPMLAVLARRLRTDDGRRLNRQRDLGDRLFQQIRDHVDCPGTGTAYHHYWVFPVLTDRPKELMDFLRDNGFDSTQGESMQIIERPDDSPAIEPSVAQHLLDRMVYLPLYPEFTERAIDKMADAVLRFYGETALSEARRRGELETVEEG